MCKTEAEIKNYKKLFFGFKRGEMMYINVIGAGLAGCECAYQIAKRGINVRLFEMKPTKRQPHIRAIYFANSFVQTL